MDVKDTRDNCICLDLRRRGKGRGTTVPLNPDNPQDANDCQMTTRTFGKSIDLQAHWDPRTGTGGCRTCALACMVHVRTQGDKQ